MRKSLITISAATAIAAAASFMPSLASAADFLGPPAAPAITGAVGEADVATDVAYTCWRAWRCGPFACGFRTVCGGRPSFAFYRPYVYRSWAYSPYWVHRPWWRPHWGWRG